MAVGLHSISKDGAQLIREWGKTMKSKALSVKSILGWQKTWPNGASIVVTPWFGYTISSPF